MQPIHHPPLVAIFPSPSRDGQSGTPVTHPLPFCFLLHSLALTLWLLFSSYADMGIHLISFHVDTTAGTPRQSLPELRTRNVHMQSACLWEAKSRRQGHGRRVRQWGNFLLLLLPQRIGDSFKLEVSTHQLAGMFNPLHNPIKPQVL